MSFASWMSDRHPVAHNAQPICPNRARLSKDLSGIFFCTFNALLRNALRYFLN
jgi:hypothetical protein